MLDLVVVGGGYWGVAIALKARAAGWNTVMLDDGDAKAGSRNASAVCDPSSYKSEIFRRFWPSDWKPEELQASFDWLLKQGGVLVKESFWNRFGGTAIRASRGSCIYLRNNDELLEKFTARDERVIGLDKQFPGLAVRTEENVYRTNRVAIAAGYRTDELLTRLGLNTLGVIPLYGRGLIARGTPRCAVPVSVMIRPYTKHTIRRWGNVYRIGDTAEEHPNDNRAKDIREVAEAGLKEMREVSWVNGYRPVCTQFIVEKVANGVVVATGGHRLGLGLAGLVGDKVIAAFR